MTPVPGNGYPVATGRTWHEGIRDRVGMWPAGRAAVQRRAGGARNPVAAFAQARRRASSTERWKKELSNWGRWGTGRSGRCLESDHAGQTPTAAALVKDGISVSLAADADTVKAVDNPTPYEVTMQGISSDRIAISYHGIAHASRFARPHQREGRLLQRLHAGRRHGGQAGSSEEFDPQRQERHRHARHPH